MSTSADIRDSQVLVRLRDALSKFGPEVVDVASALGSAIHQFEAELPELESKLQEDLGNALEHLQNCREALARCLSACQSEDGRRGARKDCSKEERTLREAERLVETYRERLQFFQTWRNRLLDMLPSLKQGCFRLTRVGEQGVEQAKLFLDGRITALGQYLAIQQQSEGIVGTAPAASSNLRTDLERLGLLKETVSPSEIRSLMGTLRQPNPIKFSEVIEKMEGFDADSASKELVQEIVQDFLNHIAREAAKDHPKVSVSVTDLTKEISGIYVQKDHTLTINKMLLDRPHELRATVFHELMHWFVDHGSDDFRQTLRHHFQKRTKGQSIIDFGEFRAKLGGWYTPYAGRVYSPNDDLGREIAPIYLEALLKGPEELANIWGYPDDRETMLIVLNGMRGEI